MLLIDDDPGVANLLGNKLSGAGFSFVSASSGVRGLDLVRERRPDIVLLDLRMPDVDGAEVISALREMEEKGTHVKIVLYTAFNEYAGIRMDEAFVRKIGADAFIEKDMDLDRVVERLHELAAGGAADGT